MATDFEGSKCVKTPRDDEFKIKIVDGQSGETATKVVSVVAVGDAYSAGTNDLGIPDMWKDNSGNAIIPTLNADGELPVKPPNLAQADDSVAIGDGTDTVAVSDTGEMSVEITNAQGTDGADAPTDTIQVGGKDSNGDLQTLKTNTDGQLEVVLVDTINETVVFDYDFTEDVAKNGTHTHDYVVTSGKTFTGSFVLVGSRGQCKCQLGTWNGTAFTIKATWFQDPRENSDHNIPKLKLLGDGTAAIRLVVKNLDDQTDIYTTIQGEEV